MKLSESYWPDLGRPGPVLVVPLGSVEQHGPHLPLDTDSRIATAVAALLVEERPELAVAPCLQIGASGEHAGFPGTLSVGSIVLEQMVVEIGRSADHFAGIIWLNAHGGNISALRRAVGQLAGEGRRSELVNCSVPGGDAHAGRTETSLLLAIAPDVVRLDRAEAGTTGPWAEIADRVLAEGVQAVSPNGVLGDPSGASADEGRQLLAMMLALVVDRVEEAVARWSHDEHDRPLD